MRILSNLQFVFCLYFLFTSCSLASGQFSIAMNGSGQIHSSFLATSKFFSNYPGYDSNRFCISPSLGFDLTYDVTKNRKIQLEAGFKRVNMTNDFNLKGIYGTLSQDDFEALPRFTINSHFNEWSIGSLFRFYKAGKNELFLSGGVSLLDFRKSNFVDLILIEGISVFLPGEKTTAKYSHSLFINTIKYSTIQLYLGVEVKKYLSDSIFFKGFVRFYNALSYINSISVSYNVVTDNTGQEFPDTYQSILKGDRIVLGLSAGIDF